MRKIPEGYKQIDKIVMTNLDHTIDEEVGEQLKKEDVYSQYSAWNFCGYVWYEDGKFYCKVMVYHFHVETVEAETLEEIMKEVSAEYGAG